MITKVAVTCFIFCFGTTNTAVQPPTDSFCSRYERQVLSEKDLEIVRELPRRIRDRIQGNELDYLCNCEGWDNPMCEEARDG